MEKNYFERVHALTPTRFWINNVTIDQAERAIAHGAVGCTQNPAYTWKMMCDEQEKGRVLRILDEMMRDEPDDNAALIKLQARLVGDVAKVFKPMFDAGRGKTGYVSIQGDPFGEDADSILEYARFHRKAGENIMAKIPAVPGGLKAIETLAKERVPINATECMAVRQVIDVCKVYENATRNLVNPAPLYYSVITGIFDEYITKTVARDQIDISPDVTWYAGLAVAKKVYSIVKQSGYRAHFIGGGARALHHFTEMVGADAQITINWTGTADKLLEADGPVVQRFFMPTPELVIDELLEKVPDFRKAYLLNAIEEEEYEEYGPVVLFRSSFEDAWKNAVNLIASRR